MMDTDDINTFGAFLRAKIAEFYAMQLDDIGIAVAIVNRSDNTLICSGHLLTSEIQAVVRHLNQVFEGAGNEL